jgi:hypothetical protein
MRTPTKLGGWVGKKPPQTSFCLVGSRRTEIVASRKSPDKRSGYGGSRFVAASSLPLEGGLLRPRRLASLFATALLRPRRAVALIVVLRRTPSEYFLLSSTYAGKTLRAYFDDRCCGIFPRNRFCRGVLLLPQRHSDYLRGRHRQALRTNLRRAHAAGIRCEAVDDPRAALDEMIEVDKHRRSPLGRPELPIPPAWRDIVAGPEVTLVVARDPRGLPLAFIAAVIDDAVCLIRIAAARSHEARWALHDHLVRILIDRGVSYLLVDGGGPFGALGVEANLHHYQHLLGYELRHLKPFDSGGLPIRRWARVLPGAARP